MLLRQALVRRHSYHFLSLSRKHSGSAILLGFSERFPTDPRQGGDKSGNDINVALLIAALLKPKVMVRLSALAGDDLDSGAKGIDKSLQ